MNDKLSQENIDNLLAGSGNDPDSSDNSEDGLKYLNSKEIDTIGEMGNISMGSAATTLSMLLGNKVEITTPRVKEHENINELFNSNQDYVFVEIDYTKGLQGSTVFVLEKTDTAIIADLMMGGDGKVTNPEIGELQLSAVGEAMNQMMGTSATSLSSMFNTFIEISAPNVNYQDKGTKIDAFKALENQPVIAVCFDLKVGDLINSEMIQVMSLPSVKDQVSKLMGLMNSIAEEVTSSVTAAQSIQASQTSENLSSALPGYNNNMTSPVSSHTAGTAPVTVQPVQFTSFNDYNNVMGESGRNLDLLMDVRLKLTVELGRTELPIKKVLELTRGSIVELDKVAGEPVELYANGKLIAKGEVVVIEDNFGLRITSIVSPDNRIKNL